jgi:hypothetical protein
MDSSVLKKCLYPKQDTTEYYDNSPAGLYLALLWHSESQPLKQITCYDLWRRFVATSSLLSNSRVWKVTGFCFVFLFCWWLTRLTHAIYVNFGQCCCCWILCYPLRRIYRCPARPVETLSKLTRLQKQILFWQCIVCWLLFQIESISITFSLKRSDPEWKWDLICIQRTCKDEIKPNSFIAYLPVFHWRNSGNKSLFRNMFVCVSKYFAVILFNVK